MGETSSVYAAGWRALYRILNAAEWPSDIVTTTGGPVFFAGFPNGAEPKEFVLVVAATLDSTEEREPTWGEPSYSERVQLRVEVQTGRLGQTEWQALDRLETLLGTVEEAIDSTEKKSERPVELEPFGATWVRSGFNRRGVGPIDQPGGGFSGWGDVLVDVTARQLRTSTP